MKPAIETTPTTVFAKALHRLHEQTKSCLVPMPADSGLAIIMLNDPLVAEMLANGGTRGRWFPRPAKVANYYARGYADQGNSFSLWQKVRDGRDVALVFGLTVRPAGSQVVQFAFHGKLDGATAGQHWQAFEDGLREQEAAERHNSFGARLARLSGRLPAP